MSETVTSAAALPVSQGLEQAEQAPSKQETPPTARRQRRNHSGQPEKAAQTLRDVKPKAFAPSTLKALGYGDIEIMTIAVPAGWSYADILKPIAWSNVAGPIAENPVKTQIDRIGSLIYANAADFMAILRINAILRDELRNPCGVEVVCIGPGVDIKTGCPCPIDVKTGLPWVGKAS